MFDRYRKIPKISHRAYIFQRPFLRELFLEGLILGGAYIRWEFCVAKPIGLAYSSKVNLKKYVLPYRFCLVLFCIWGQFPSISPQGLVFGGAI